MGLCEEYIHIRSLPIVVNLFIEKYEYTPKSGDVIFSDVYRPHLRVVVFVARAYEHGWGVEKNHEKAVEIIRETESYPKDGTFSVNSDLIKNAYKEITGNEFPDSESSEQKEKQAISDAAKNMKDSGTTAKSTDTEHTPGQTATPMRANGKTTNVAVGASSSNTANPRAVKHI